MQRSRPLPCSQRGVPLLTEDRNDTPPHIDRRQVLGLVEKRAATLEHVVVDTPGQIEIFTWSASGQLVSEVLTDGHGRHSHRPTADDIPVRCPFIVPVLMQRAHAFGPRTLRRFRRRSRRAFCM